MNLENKKNIEELPLFLMLADLLKDFYTPQCTPKQTILCGFRR
jgi:hypothetical protein